MKFELGTLDWTVIISAISTVILLFALLWAMFSPGHKEKNRKKEEASFLRVSIRLYLDVLNDKLKRVLERTLHDQSPWAATSKGWLSKIMMFSKTSSSVLIR